MVPPEVVVGLGARVSDGCETLEVVNEDVVEVLLLDVEVLWRDDDSELLLRLDEADVLDAVKVVETVVVVDSVDGVPERVRDDCEFVENVRLGLEELLSVLDAVVLVRVVLAFADKNAKGGGLASAWFTWIGNTT